MSILFEVNTATMSAGEAHALAGFLDALFPGRTPMAAPAPLPSAAQAPAPAAAPANPQALADALINAEAARVAGAPLVPPAPAPSAGATTGASSATASPGAEAVTYPITLPNGTEVDAEGLPWDKRIHSENKGLVKAGIWKLRRNVEDALVAQVKSELRQAMSAPPAVPVATPAFVPPAPAPAPGQAPAFVPPAPGQAQAPAFVPPAPGPAIQVEGGAPAQAPAAVDASAFAAASFADLMARVVDLSVAGVTPDVINGLCAQVGLSQPRDANVRPDLVPQLMALLATVGA